VVSHASAEPSWRNSVLVTGEVVSEIKKLKEMAAPDLWVWGSSKLIQTLLNHDLVDEMYIWTHPLTVGGGKRLFKAGTRSTAFRLASSQVTPRGVIITHYAKN
jgi:dihydrofolate reductase